MPRPARLHFPGALYVVTSRAMEGGLLFRDPKDYETFLDFLQGYRQQFGFKLFAYVLLPNYLQLCLELTGPTTISEIMHAVNSRYTKYYRKRYDHTGHLFQERFKSTLMEKAPSLLRISTYLHAYPRRSGLVSELGHYPWSSYPSYLSFLPRASSGIHAGITLASEIAEVLQELTRLDSGMSYEAYVDSVHERTFEEIEAQLQEWVAGSEAFVAMVKDQAKALRQDPPPPSPQPSSPRLQGTPARRVSSLVTTGSLVIAFVSLCAVSLYAKNLTTVRRMIQSLAQERSIIQVGIGEASIVKEMPTAQLATLHQTPSPLSGTSWQVQIFPTTGQEQAIQQDHLEFREGKVVSDLLSAQGVSPSNYTLTLEPDGVVVWQTMQTDPVGTVVCWRGEWRGTMMRGVMTRQLPGSIATNLSFIGTLQTPRGAMHETTSEI